MINIISIWSPLLPTLIGVVFFSNFEKKTRWIIALVFVSALVQLGGNVFNIIQPKWLLYNSNVILEFSFLTAFFWNRYTNKWRKFLFLSSIVVCLVVGFISLWTHGIKSKFLTQWLSINNLAFTMWTLLLVYEYYKDDFIFVKKHPSILCFLIGLFLYNCSTVFIFPFWEYIIEPNNPFNALIPIHATFNTLMYIIISLGLYIEIREYRRTDKL